MATIHGQVNDGGVATINGTAFTATRLSKGKYQVEFPSGSFSAAPVVVATAIDSSNSGSGSGNRVFATVTSWSATKFTIAFKQKDGDLKDQGFNFVTMGA